MTQKQIQNVSASVRARLQNYAKATGEEFGYVLARYATERFLYQLSVSPHANRFVLKGANLLLTLPGNLYRITGDLDLLGRGESGTEAVSGTIIAIIGQPVPDDGLIYLAATLRVAEIRSEQEYGGIRVTMVATLGNARIPMQIDVGFGDAITPAPRTVQFPTILDLPAPTILAYPAETVIAEKVEAIVQLGLGTSRMKDFYDILLLASQIEFDGPVLSAAIRATFERRGTPIPVELPIAFTETFVTNELKAAQWAGFVKRIKPNQGLRDLDTAVANLRTFVWPVLSALGKNQEFPYRWSDPKLGWTH